MCGRSANKVTDAMKLPIFFVVIFLSPSLAVPAQKRQIQTGIVPIFDTRLTHEPITFTFTTPRIIPKTTPTPPKNQYPTLRPSGYGSNAGVYPADVNNNVERSFSSYDKENPYQLIDLQNIQISTPIYNQAQYYKAMQAALQQDVSSTYRAIWHQLGDTWGQMKSQIQASGVQNDWRQFWQHLTGAVEPHLNTIGEQVGRLINTFLKQQQIRVARRDELVQNYMDSADVKRAERINQTITLMACPFSASKHFISLLLSRSGAEDRLNRMQIREQMDGDEAYEDFENVTDCTYRGTDHIDEKILLIGVFATFIAILSIIFNTFYTIVFIKNPSIRRSGVFYFGIIAVIDTIMAVNYIAVMSLPVYMDYLHYLPLWHLFLSYFRVVLAESNCAMFSSLLMILLATTERLLKTFSGKRIDVCRKFLEENRAKVSACCILAACAYKICVYWEIDVSIKGECDDAWGKYEIVAGPLARIPEYRIWWMFIMRNVVDRILPFFLLIAMNVVIIRAVKKEEKKRQQKESVDHNAIRSTANPKTHRKNVRDATRALVSLVSMYILSQALQVLLTFWETIDRSSLEDGFPVMYSYLNDIVSIFTLLSSCLRFPVYFACNRLIHTAALDTLAVFRINCTGRREKPAEYSPIHGNPETGSKTLLNSPIESNDRTITYVPKQAAIYDERLQEWRL
ncbi:unnamed protein product [Caenorhabditis auriculariae]|uniref:G-protein coupled receptors family 1 profile domain-containing protein n=1 Tax=Caenorhabditis auriculariae TaxID=2777116 RepID=A0A8S1GW97_9PELO|nr:unnamed protein product [Caenorhabditis auriculariae]